MLIMLQTLKVCTVKFAHFYRDMKCLGRYDRASKVTARMIDVACGACLMNPLTLTDWSLIHDQSQS